MRFENIRIVLVEPLYGGNVGSVCRAMANMALTDLALVAPRNLDMDEARKMAVHANDILEQRSEFPDLAAAIADCGVVMGATARKGLYRQHSSTPKELAPEILKASASGKVALVFGREDNGLSNDEVGLCTHIVQIPSSEKYISLNLSQAVMVCCYEVFAASGVFEPSEEKSDIAPSELRERMFSIWKNTLLDIGFMDEDKKDHMMLGLRRVLSRGQLTVDDVRIMMGIARQAEWAAARAKGGSSKSKAEA